MNYYSIEELLKIYDSVDSYLNKNEILDNNFYSLIGMIVPYQKSKTMNILNQMKKKKYNDNKITTYA